jgi:hypothetical protein
MKAVKALLGSIGCALVLAACGGGGGGSGAGTAAGLQDASAGAQFQTPAASPDTSTPNPPTGSTTQPPAPVVPPPGTVPAQRPDVMVASMDEIAAWNAACTTDDCRITLPPRSGRSLTWWGTDPRLMEQVNETCGPQPGCRVPDGDLLVWNFDCSPQPTCRIRLSRTY